MEIDLTAVWSFLVGIAIAVAAYFGLKIRSNSTTNTATPTAAATTETAATAVTEASGAEVQESEEEETITVEPGNATITGIWTGKVGDYTPQTAVQVAQGLKRLFVGAFGTDEGNVDIGIFVNGILVSVKSYDVQKANLGKIVPLVIEWPGDEIGTYKVLVKVGNQADIHEVESPTKNPYVWGATYGPYTVEVT